MKIFFPIDINTVRPGNPYFLDLMRELNKDADVELISQGVGLFSTKPGWDVIHIQFPEALTGWKTPTDKQLERIAVNLDKAKASGSVVICTIHNYEPKADMGENGHKLFTTVFERTDGFIHLGQKSVEDFVSKYKDKNWAKRYRHHVIYHSDYDYYRELDRVNEIADEISALPRPIFLVFGALRTADEEKLAREAFQKAKLASGTLVFAGQFHSSAISAKDKRTLISQKSSNIRRYHKKIDDEEVIPIFEAVDFVLLPRAGRLNSGIQALAYTFDKPLIAPDEGVIGELMNLADGFRYQKGSATAASRAIRRAAKASEEDLAARRKKVRAFRDTHMLRSAVAARHLEVYRKVIRKFAKKPTRNSLRSLLSSYVRKLKR